MKLKSYKPFEIFEKASTEQTYSELQQMIKNEGYASFSHLLEGFRQKLKLLEEDEIEEVRSLIEKGKRLFPQPELFSPSFIYVWDYLTAIFDVKIRMMSTISPDLRDGEWQILLDNPYSHHEITCYPNLTFYEAAYLYGYLQVDLKKNEYIRLQKIQTHVIEFGS